MAVRPNGMQDTSQYQIQIDQAKAGAMGINLSDISNTMSITWGGSYINDFLDLDRIKKICTR